MRSWHPISKLAIGLGLAGLALVWWTDQGGPETAVVAGRPAQAEGVINGAAAMSGGPPADAASPAPVLMARVLPPEATLEAMVARPLFSPDRRPFVPGVATDALPVAEWLVEPAAGPGLPAFRFIGSIVEDGRVRAIVSDGFNVRGVVVGEEVDGWTVRDIEARRLTLASDAETFEMTILE